ncbi:MAG: anaerobic ribonucleoside-triphosphate reductase activating protein [Clostridia bacterium]|nr:anaerobic ribonucleoside-triphosphate reductase activating protein [Clostridia bacterium]
MPIRLYGIVRESIVDGPGLRFVVFVQGCPHHCPGCHNPESHDPDGGFATTTVRIWENLIRNPSLRGVTFSGGEPFLWAKELAEIGRCARARGLDVMTYSGWTWEELQETAKTDDGVRDLLSVTRYLVDGRFEQDRRDLSLRFRGSSNQHIRNIDGWPENGDAVVLDDQWK